MQMWFTVFLATLLCQWKLVFAAPGAVQSVEPDTCPGESWKPKHFDLFLTWEDSDNVGRVKKTILMNGQSPGPALEMQVGESVEFVVHNLMPFGTTIHFHGITQLGTPWSDGVPGVSQTPIEPGASFNYRWTADEPGTYFYHAHRYGQIADGLSGAIIIYPDPNEPAPFGDIAQTPQDLAAIEAAVKHAIPVIVSDWSHWTFDEFFDIEEQSGIDLLCTDATIINGKVCRVQHAIHTNWDHRTMSWFSGLIANHSAASRARSCVQGRTSSTHSSHRHSHPS